MRGMLSYRFDETCVISVQAARRTATENKSPNVLCVHVLYGVIIGSNVGAAILADIANKCHHHGFINLRRQVRASLSFLPRLSGQPISPDRIPYDMETRRMFEYADGHMTTQKIIEIGCDNLIVGIFMEGGAAAYLLRKAGVYQSVFEKRVKHMLKNS